MQITPFILGSGNAATAIVESLRVLEATRPAFRLAPIRRLQRDEPLTAGDAVNPVLVIANPHALHAPAILKGDAAGFVLIICEKPAATSLQQIESLQAVTVPVAVCHGYRQMWGIQTLRQMVSAGEFGDVIAIEGRYWQSSAAQQSLMKDPPSNWKNDAALSGPSDTTIDIAGHWADAALYVHGETPESASIWRSHTNAAAPHRDTHVHLQMQFPNGSRALGSISKTVHGAPNHFEINVIGSRKYACWKFLEADQIDIGEGARRVVVTREGGKPGSGHAPFHGLGWIEGYIEIIDQAVRGLGGEPVDYPTLTQHLTVMQLLLTAPNR